jgi:hypothetical protein
VIDRQHRLKVGQMVEIIPTTQRSKMMGRYEITRLVPCDSNDPRYRLRGEDQKNEWVLPEAELIPLDTP